MENLATIIILISILTFSNFVTQVILKKRDWERAAERSFYQAAAVLFTWWRLS